MGAFCSRECKDKAPYLTRADGKKFCAKCLAVKPLEEFSASRSSFDGRYSFCRECSRLASAQWRTANPERYLELHRGRTRTEAQKEYRFERDLQAKYGLSLARYQRMLDDQGDACAVCKGPPTKSKGGRFHVDHDHSCCPGAGSCGGCVRGLLCGNCNTAIGLLSDDPVRLQAAIDYLNN